MVKLMLCILCGLAVAAVMLQLRQQRLELSYESSKLHHSIKQTHIKLWNQQLQIASETTPTAIRHTVKQYDMALVPSKPNVPNIEEERNADAE